VIDIAAHWFVEALTFARAAHAGQVDQAQHSNPKHVGRVALRLIRMFPEVPRQVVQAAILHDVIEDAAVSSDDLRALFGRRVAVVVQLLTRPRGEAYIDYIAKLAASADGDAIRVKLADLIDRSNATAGSDPDRQRLVEELYAPARVTLESALHRFSRPHASPAAGRIRERPWPPTASRWR
jgi:(p)ppGpp synthase/HD superfamily hydrolase